MKMKNVSHCKSLHASKPNTKTSNNCIRSSNKYDDECASATTDKHIIKLCAEYKKALEDNCGNNININNVNI